MEEEINVAMHNEEENKIVNPQISAGIGLEEHILVKVVLNIWNSGTSSQEGEPSIDPGVHKCIRKQKKEEMNARQIPKT